MAVFITGNSGKLGLGVMLLRLSIARLNSAKFLLEGGMGYGH